MLRLSAPNEDWATVTLLEDDFLPKVIEGRLGHKEPVRMRFASPRVRQIEPVLRALCVPQHALVNGAPDRAMNGLSFAQTLAGGRLVTLAMTEGGAVLEDSGILVILNSSIGPGGPLVQGIDMVFYPMDPGSRLYNAVGTYEEVPGFGDEDQDNGEGEDDSEGESP